MGWAARAQDALPKGASARRGKLRAMAIEPWDAPVSSVHARARSKPEESAKGAIGVRHPCMIEDGTYEHRVPEGEETCCRCNADSSAMKAMEAARLERAEQAALKQDPLAEQPVDLTPAAEGERLEVTPVQLALLQRMDRALAQNDMIIQQNAAQLLVLGALMAAVHGDTPRLPPEVWKMIGCTPKEESGIVVPTPTL